MKLTIEEFEELLPGYFAGELSEEFRVAVEEKIVSSPEAKKQFENTKIAWESFGLLDEMEGFNSFEALNNVNKRLLPNLKNRRFRIQKYAAILVIALIGYAGGISYKYFKSFEEKNEYSLVETINCRYGMVTKFKLPDSTEVWLNSGSQLTFPHNFANNDRTVELTGEAYFQVKHDETKPFIVNLRNLQVEVLGTEFNVANYSDEEEIEVVLAQGKVKLSSKINGNKKVLGTMTPGYQAIFDNQNGKVLAHKVNPKRYTSWRDGTITFYDEPMDVVAKRLGRWFNADINIVDKEINEYVYRATFSSESLEQVLKLLKISAPVDYEIKPREELSDGTFEKKQIYISKRKN